MIAVVLLVSLFVQPFECLASPPDPETQAAYLHYALFARALQAYSVGVGLGLLIKMLNRS